MSKPKRLQQLHYLGPIGIQGDQGVRGNDGNKGAKGSEGLMGPEGQKVICLTFSWQTGTLIPRLSTLFEHNFLIGLSDNLSNLYQN